MTALVTRHAARPRPGSSGRPWDRRRDRLRRRRSWKRRVAQAHARYATAFEAFQPHDALTAVWDALYAGNEYLSRVAPWTLARDPVDRPAFDRTLAAAVRLLARSAVLLGPVIPEKADELWRALGGPGSVHDQRLGDIEHIDPTGWSVTSGTPLFPRANVIPRSDSTRDLL